MSRTIFKLFSMGTTVLVVMVTMQNGSKEYVACVSMQEAYDKANNISYSGGRVKRVECERRVLWDASWDDESKARGLQCPL
jgi:hypothetical protein